MSASVRPLPLSSFLFVLVVFDFVHLGYGDDVKTRAICQNYSNMIEDPKLYIVYGNLTVERIQLSTDRSTLRFLKEFTKRVDGYHTCLSNKLESTTKTRPATTASTTATTTFAPTTTTTTIFSTTTDPSDSSPPTCHVLVVASTNRTENASVAMALPVCLTSEMVNDLAVVQVMVDEVGVAMRQYAVLVRMMERELHREIPSVLGELKGKLIPAEECTDEDCASRIEKAIKEIYDGPEVSEETAPPTTVTQSVETSTETPTTIGTKTEDTATPNETSVEQTAITSPTTSISTSTMTLMTNATTSIPYEATTKRGNTRIVIGAVFSAAFLAVFVIFFVCICKKRHLKQRKILEKSQVTETTSRVMDSEKPSIGEIKETTEIENKDEIKITQSQTGREPHIPVITGKTKTDKSYTAKSLPAEKTQSAKSDPHENDEESTPPSDDQSPASETTQSFGEKVKKETKSRTHASGTRSKSDEQIKNTELTA